MIAKVKNNLFVLLQKSMSGMPACPCRSKPGKRFKGQVMVYNSIAAYL